MLTTINEIVKDLITKMKPEDYEYVYRLKRDEMSKLNFGYGMYIRNHYGLWTDNPLTETWRTDSTTHVIKDGIDCSLDHPDAVSMDIMYALWDKIHG